MNMDQELIVHICLIANRAAMDRYTDVAKWMQRYLAEDIQQDRSRKGRKRGVHVRLGNARGPHAILDADAIKRLGEEA